MERGRVAMIGSPGGGVNGVRARQIRALSPAASTRWTDGARRAAHLLFKSRPSRFSLAGDPGGVLEALERAGGDRELADIRAAMRTVKIRAAGFQQTEPRGEGAQSSDGDRTVLRVPDLDAAQAEIGEALQPRFLEAEARVREHGDAAGAVDQ